MREKYHFLYISECVAFRVKKPNIFIKILVWLIGWKIRLHCLDTDDPEQRYSLWVSEYPIRSLLLTEDSPLIHQSSSKP